MNQISGLFRAARPLLSAALLALALTVAASAQGNFSSGSTGADGPFAPTTNQTLIVPDSGVYNFTTVNIPSGVTVTFLRNPKNTTLTILASGDVNIVGTISVAGRSSGSAGSGGYGGPGGFNGGNGASGFDSFAGQPGEGPGGGGGGAANANTSFNGAAGGGGGYASAGAATSNGTATATGGQRYGVSTLLPLVGGSGGGGGSARSGIFGSGGGGGGGALLVASSTRITVTGAISADGGGGVGGNANSASGGGGGAGGAVRLIANEIAGAGNITARGGPGGPFVVAGGGGGAGYVRMESFNLTFNGTATPAVIASLPGPVTSPTQPTLRITSVAGVAAPDAPRGSLSASPDVIVPADQTNPVTVNLATTNVPVGTTIQVILTPPSGARTNVTSSAIAGTAAAGTAAASVTLPNGISIISATATFALPETAASQPMFVEGERVERVEVAAIFGGASEVTYITRSGRRVKRTSE